MAETITEFGRKIGDNIVSLRDFIGLKQEYVATKLGVSRQAVSKWEAGLSIPPPKMLKKIASFFNVSIDRIIGDKPKLICDHFGGCPYIETCSYEIMPYNKGCCHTCPEAETCFRGIKPLDEGCFFS